MATSVVVLAAGVSCGPQEAQDAAPDTLPSTAYSAGNPDLSAAIYAVAVADMQSRYPGQTVIDLRTSVRDIGGDAWPDADRRVRADPLIDTTLWRALAELNKESRSLDPESIAAFMPDVIQARAEQQEALVAAGYMGPEFGRAFPGSSSAVRVSAVAFSPDERSAVVYVSLHCGGLCGQGAVYSMSFNGSHWEVARCLSLWVA